MPRLTNGAGTRMGNVSPFERKRPQKSLPDGHVSWPEFTDRMDTPEFINRVQKEMDNAFSRTQNELQRVVVGQCGIDKEFVGRRGGTLYPSSTMANRVVTSNEFPDYLVEEKLEREKAIDLASGSVLAYGALHDWIRSQPRRNQDKIIREGSKPSMQPQHPELWQAGVYDQSTRFQSLHVMTHRSAARVALNVTGLAPLSLPEETQLPLHLAALADPFTNKQTRFIHDLAVSWT